MSEMELREASKRGDSSTVRDLLIKKCNPCSPDEYGLNSLHFAVWNGHLECVKLLAANNIGVDLNGHRSSSINMRSSMGLTPLHLAAMESPMNNAKEIVLILLIFGADLSIRSQQGKSPEELAVENENTSFLNTLSEYIQCKEQGKNNHLIEKLKKEMAPLCFQIEKRGIDAQMGKKYAQLFPDIFNDQPKTGSLPTELSIHEHQIKPLSRLGFENLSGKDSLNTLQFARNQALLNKARREKILSSNDDQFRAVDMESQKS